MTELRQLDDACATAMGVGVYTLCGDDGVPMGTPHYSTDFAAVRLLEDDIEKRGLHRQYVDWLCASTALCSDTTDQCWALIRATPEQRARAYLKARGLS